jgi:ABC-2 type transport system permease protein
MERERGWLALKRVMPMPPGAYLLAKMAMAMLFALIIYVVLGLMAFFLGGVRLQIGQWLLLGVIAALGAIPFSAIGMMIGSKANASASPAFVNLIYLPMAFLSGLWMPLTMLPSFFTQIAPLWPSYHLAQLAQMTIDTQPWADVGAHLVWLVGFTAVCFAIARRWLAKAA